MARLRGWLSVLVSLLLLGLALGVLSGSAENLVVQGEDE